MQEKTMTGADGVILMILLLFLLVSFGIIIWIAIDSDRNSLTEEMCDYVDDRSDAVYRKQIDV